MTPILLSLVTLLAFVQCVTFRCLVLTERRLHRLELRSGHRTGTAATAPSSALEPERSTGPRLSRPGVRS